MMNRVALMREAVKRMNRRVVVALIFAVMLVGYGMTAIPVQGQVVSNEVLAEAALAQSIPGDAIRLRIIANSDKPEDQQLKRLVRDEVIQVVAAVVEGAKSPEEAQAKIAAALPKFQETAERVIAENGFSYAAQTDFGLVPFPTKMYGSEVYPAGDYEALRIQIGEAQGQNWWCVLFPPLCFVDMANGDAVQAQDMETAPIATAMVVDSSGDEQEVQVRSAFWDAIVEWFASLFESIASWFD
ncbi:stage II sporulation protein R [Tumebacillus lipolyticus]|uniref:Stage II sporulation protein R n=1 Tax=Tumebacillus lipolyticus TaxID=1280370 RepID=A0ABW4ZXU0_9BACL